MTALADWMAAYERAWASNDRDEIGVLFTDDARYFTAPFREPWRGRQAIVDGWLDRKDEPGTWTFEWQPLLDTPELAIVTGTTTYREPPLAYSNLWVLRLADEGRCREFTEWWMAQSEANASYKKQKRNEGVTEIVEIPNRGHALTIDSGWREVADTALAFVKRFV